MTPDGPDSTDESSPATPPTDRSTASSAKPAAKKPGPATRPPEAKAAPKAAPKAGPQGVVLPQAPPWWKTLRADPPAHTRMLLGVGFIALIMLLWWFVTRGDEINVYFDGRKGELLLSLKASTARIVSASKIPSPGDVFGSFGSLLDRELGRNLGDTLQRVLSGVALAAVVGVSVGIVAASHRGVNAAIAPLVIFLRSVPMGALIPLTMLLFGDGEGQKTKFIFLAIVGFVFSDTVKAMSIVPERYVETAQTLGASRFQIIRKVLVPLAIPDIVTSLRFQFGLALGYIMLAEEINAEFGIGKLIMGSQRVGPYEHMYLLLFVIALIAFTIDLVLRTLQRGIFPWRRDL
jgi:ABC-type nitrate/sulfonate/bicarbonate transport system permease component